jgi:hypothetical protein
LPFVFIPRRGAGNATIKKEIIPLLSHALEFVIPPPTRTGCRADNESLILNFKFNIRPQTTLFKQYLRNPDPL